MDAGCDFRDYASDISRAWPISRRFTPVQSDVYEAVLQVQEGLITALHRDPRLSLSDLQRRCIADLTQAARNLSMACTLQSILKYYPHMVGHHLGVDVHDCNTVSNEDSLAAKHQCVVTIEPGLYFPPNDDSVPKGLRGVGFRIEDDVVVRPSGVEVLTSAVPKGRKALEQLLAGN
eukprot:m.152930 g.152930  ORF g.152930 m.152930 type:complete len:176 (-) comp52849_c0_seq45:1877-2404(-)